jgi:uncharacterized Zn finger protein (UPF0148 family)
MILSTTVACDKCGRPIPTNKGYIMVNGWIICGLCQYESGKYTTQTDDFRDRPMESQQEYFGIK